MSVCVIQAAGMCDGCPTIRVAMSRRSLKWNDECELSFCDLYSRSLSSQVTNAIFYVLQCLRSLLKWQMRDFFLRISQGRFLRKWRMRFSTCCNVSALFWNDQCRIFFCGLVKVAFFSSDECDFSTTSMSVSSQVTKCDFLTIRHQCRFLLKWWMRFSMTSMSFSSQVTNVIFYFNVAFFSSDECRRFFYDFIVAFFSSEEMRFSTTSMLLSSQVTKCDFLRLQCRFLLKWWMRFSSSMSLFSQVTNAGDFF